MTDLRTRLLLAAAVILAAVALAPMAARAQAPAALHLIDVPYLPQSEALCGGAAVAMVMRYWGATGVYAETFAPLVDREAGGIRGDALLRELHERTWTAVSVRGDPEFVQQRLARRQPVIALIEDRPARYHYVVIVGWAGGRVILHDPARAPFRVIDQAPFVRSWEPTGFWTLLVSPPAAAPRSTPEPPADPDRADAPCAGMVEEGVRLAGTGDAAGARRLFDAAMTNCPASPAPWRERAGLRALASQWPAAAADAREALARDEHDGQAARILATALYLQDDRRGALAAWNLLGEPVIDIVNVTGLERTRFAVAASALGLRPGDLLTPATLDRAARRVDLLPAAQVTRVSYRPGENGRAQIEAVVIERPLVPASVAPLVAMGARAITDREVGVTVSSPTGGGEVWRATWRWWEHRPRVGFGFEAPAPFGGTWGIDAAGERQTYQSGPARVVETRGTARFHVSDWTASALRWEASAGVDSVRGRGRGMSLGATLEQRLLEDRLAVLGRGAVWSRTADAWSAALGAEWRSSARHEGPVWLARGGIALAGEAAPLALWPGAGAGQGRDLLLRAHPLLRKGIVSGGVFGRRVADAGVEWRGWRTLGPGFVRLAPAVFLDSARASRGLTGSNEQWQFDAGVGLRLALPGSGVVRLDLARGLRDGGFVLSAGWTR